MRRSRVFRALLLGCTLVLLASTAIFVATPRTHALAPAWQPGVFYAVGALASYNNTDYKAIQAHTSQVGWEPPNVPALWTPNGTGPTATTAPATATRTRTNTTGGTVPTATRTATTGGTNPTATRTRTNTTGTGTCGTTNIAQGKPATSSSNETTSLTPNLAVDGNTGTRWASAAADPSWIRVDLGATTSICRVQLLWEAAYGRSYQIQTSNDGASWTTIYSTTAGDGGTDNLTVAGSGRYVRMNGTVRATQWGYSLWELQVYSGSGTVPTSTTGTNPTATRTNTSGTTPPTATRTRTATSGTTPPTATRTATTSTGTTCGLLGAPSGKVLVGYWETWDGSSTHPGMGHIPLSQTHANYNVIDVAFPVLLSDGTMVFQDGMAPGEDVPTPAEICAEKAKGRRVLLSIGGAAAGIDLSNRAVVQRFIDTSVPILKQYNFDGIDIDIESGLTAGTSWTAPSASQTNLIFLIDGVLAQMPSNFMLTMAPETAYVTGGQIAYGGPWGAYLPIIKKYLDNGRLNWLQMQYYNGSMYGCPATSYNAGTVEGFVEQTRCMNNGFQVAAGGPVISIPYAKQVPGLPAQSGAGGGYMAPSLVSSAYSQVSSIKGLMTWSINWDGSKGWTFATTKPF